MRRQVLVREVCPECRGDGYIVHPAWRAHRTLGEQGLREWFAQEGYDEPPPEEVPCPECDGQRYVMRWVDIATLLREVRDA